MGEIIYPVEFYGWRDAIKLPVHLRERWNRAEDKRVREAHDRAWDLLFSRQGIPLDSERPRCEVIDITPFLEHRRKDDEEK